MRRRRGMTLFVLAAAAGLLHAAPSLYWALGGNALLDTVGEFAVDLRRSGEASVTVMLWIITLAKAAGALVPLVDHLRPPAHRWVRAVSWAGVVVLLIWGGAGMIGAWIGLAAGGGITPALAGHAFLWDPLFVAWALLLAGALIRSRPWCSAGGRAERR